MTMDIPVITDIKKRLEILVDSTVNATTQVDCGLQTMQYNDFLSRAIQDFEKCGLAPNVTLLHEIDTECAKFYKSVQRILT